MKKQIFEALKTKFAGVQDAILDRVATKLAKTVLKEEDVAAAVEGVTLQQVIDGEADRRATEATQSAVTNYEKKHGLKDGQKVAEGGEANKQIEPKPNDDTPAWAKALIDSQKQLAEKLASIEGEKVVTTRKQKLETIINKLPENLRKPYLRIPLKDMTDEAFETLTSEITTEVEGLATEVSTKGAVFGRPMAGKSININNADKEASKEEVDAIVGGMKI